MFLKILNRKREAGNSRVIKVEQVITYTLIRDNFHIILGRFLFAQDLGTRNYEKISPIFILSSFISSQGCLLDIAVSDLTAIVP